MLPNRGLPDEYVMPQWWCPTRAEESALVEPISGETAPAAMRVMYEVVGGSLPFAFMTELQVSLVLQKSKGQKTFSPESSVVDRVAGSVLSESYTCGEGNIREWVVVSQSCLLLDLLRRRGERLLLQNTRALRVRAVRCVRRA